MKFDAICPTWAKIIHSEKEIPKDDKRKFWTDIRRPARCVVAEAYGFSDDYAVSDDFPITKKYKKCNLCREFATKFSELVSPLLYVREDHAWKKKLYEEFKDKNKEVVIKMDEVDADNVNISAIEKLENMFVDHWTTKHEI